MTSMITDRPVITFALFAYNQESYIRAAVQGAFAQTYEPLEIVLSDDCSTDRTFEIMQEMVEEYEGPHRIVLNRNASNQGLCRHVNTLFRLATGEIVVVAAGDDISLPQRVAQSQEIFDRYPNVLSVSMEYSCIDDLGLPFSAGRSGFREGKYTLQDLLAHRNIPIHGATRAYRTCIAEIFGPIDDSCRIEDVVLRLRSLLAGCIYHSHAEGVLYRVHTDSLSRSIKEENQYSVYRQNMRDLRKAVSHSLIQKKEAEKIRYALRSIIARGLVLAKHQRARYPLFSFFTNILPSGYFTGYDKISQLYATIRGGPLAPLAKMAKRVLR